MAKHFLGGQAVVEGVMMLYKDQYAVAVQTKNGIKVKKEPFPLQRKTLMKLPFIRGIILLFTTLFVGLKAMGWSAHESGEEDEEFTGAMLAWTILISLFLALLLFKILPLILANLIVSREEAILFNILDGLLRIGIFVGYIWLISRTKDVQRLFQYHGAEHKVINAYEATGRFSIKDSKKATRLHPRCSTSFVVLVLVVAIIIFSLVPLTMDWHWLILTRLALVLPIAGISWELIRLAGIHADKPLVKPFLQPGYWVQQLTTREPDEQQLRVAIKAAKAVTQ